MTEKLRRTATAGISAEFGYYPVRCEIDAEEFSIRTLTDHDETVSLIEGEENLISDWLYPGAHKRLDFMSGKIQSLPYSGRIFGLPKTHILTLHKDCCRAKLDFVVWCISFFVGMRLTTTEAGFLDATPTKPCKLVDFSLRKESLGDAVQISLNFFKREHKDQLATKRVAAIIHALYLAQYPQNLPFESFQYLYMALDSCFKLLAVKEGPKLRVPHSDRIHWMCEKFSIDTPEWASRQSGESEVANVRNNAIHEALFFGEPLGFSIYGGNDTGYGSQNVILQMRALTCRLLVAILGQSQSRYVRSPINNRIKQSLDLKA